MHKIYQWQMSEMKNIVLSNPPSTEKKETADSIIQKRFVVVHRLLCCIHSHVHITRVGGGKM